MEPWRYTACRAAEEMRAGRLMAEEYVLSCLERTSACDSEVRAWTYLDPEMALAQARQRDNAPVRGPLHGIPVGFKDIIDTFDLPTEYNSPIYHGYRPQCDASCVAITCRAGGIVMGKTATTEFAYRSPASTRNPHNFAHTPGGSSSGSAAAVASFMAPIAVGSQTGGSTIRPASYCGVVGYKPTFGTINRAGVKSVAESLDHVGVFARSVEDVALFTHAIAGIAVPDFATNPPAAPRVGFCRQSAWNEGDAGMHEKLELAASVLAAGGANVREVELGTDFAAISDDQMVINDYELARALAFEFENHHAKLSQQILENINRGWNLPRERYVAALQNAARYRALFAVMMRDFDFLLTPAAAGEAPAGLALTGTAAFNRAWTLLGVPCVTVPAYTGPRGLPIGVQIVGAYGADRDTLMWAASTLCVLTA